MEVRTLTDGGQPAVDTANALAEFVAAAQHTLDIAVYDLNLPDDLVAIVGGALRDANARGVALRLAYNVDHPRIIPVPPPPRTDPDVMASLPFPTAAIPGIPDLMHHKYIVRDAASVWTGSTNWTGDSWTREENVIVTIDSPELATRYTADFEQLWTSRNVQHSGKVDTSPLSVSDTSIRPWFCPGRGEQLAHRIAKAIGTATRRVRIASPVLSSAPILATLAQVVTDGKVDVAGVVDRTQVLEVIHQWTENGNASWKEPLLRTVLTHAPFSGKISTPYGPGTVHDYMHAKVTVADDVVFVGSFNLSHSGELNAENVLEIADAALAERLAAFIDEVRAKYPPTQLP
ncbi:MAG TPA: phospholipase D-like domain-containing protein [Gaiellaceae bacterium]|nr:phospholipase D-like domain-containing protein [Gaiellaceae bacterium]